MNKDKFLVKDGDRAEWGVPEGYPYKEMGEVALIEEYVLELADQNGQILCGFPGAFFVPGSTYKITWDGTDYICTAEELQGTIAIGNLASLGGTGNNEPFAMTVGRNSTTILVLEGGVHGTTKTVSISEFTETIHPMAPEFLPAGGGASSADVFIIHATTDETFTNVQLDKTAEQIYEAYQSRKYCLVDFNGTFYPVTSVETNGSKYLMSGNGFAFPTSEQGSAAGFELATSDGVTWSVNRKTPYLYNVRFNGLQISGPGNQYYTISVDTNGNLTATVVT